jgi:hypothetical protein
LLAKKIYKKLKRKFFSAVIIFCIFFLLGCLGVAIYNYFILFLCCVRSCFSDVFGRKQRTLSLMLFEGDWEPSEIYHHREITNTETLGTTFHYRAYSGANDGGYHLREGKLIMSVFKNSFQ